MRLRCFRLMVVVMRVVAHWWPNEMERFMRLWLIAVCLCVCWWALQLMIARIAGFSQATNFGRQDEAGVGAGRVFI